MVTVSKLTQVVHMSAVMFIEHLVFLPGESQGWGSLVGFRLWGRTESDTTVVT